MIATFTLREDFALDGGSTWRLRAAEIRHRGTGRCSQLVNRRIPAGDDQIASFVDALNLLDVWSWRDNYDPEDVGFAVLDGISWAFTASIDVCECKCGGGNAYPAFSDPSQTSLNRGRYALLLAAMYACFDIDTYIHIAKHQRPPEIPETG